jgi:hypothetical protein
MVMIGRNSTTSSMIEGVINDIMHYRARSLIPPRRTPERVTTLAGRGSFRTLVPSLRKVAWSDKLKPGSIDKYDGSSNPDEFIQVYHMVIQAIGGDDRVKTNYLLTTFSSAARSWLINLPEGTNHSWDQLCAIFIDNF